MQTVRPVYIYLSSLLETLPKWFFSPLSTQFADIYNIPLLIIKEDHLGERNSSLLLQSVQGRAEGNHAGFLAPLASLLFSLQISTLISPYLSKCATLLPG